MTLMVPQAPAAAMRAAGGVPGQQAQREHGPVAGAQRRARLAAGEQVGQVDPPVDVAGEQADLACVVQHGDTGYIGRTWNGAQCRSGCSPGAHGAVAVHSYAVRDRGGAGGKAISRRW